VDRDGGDLQLAFHRPLVERLDVLEDVLEAVAARVDQRRVVREGVEHECVVGVGRVSEA
jgi:hypothetical protein